MNRKWDIEDTETNRKCIEEVISRIQEIENPDAVGMIAAQDVIDIVKEHLAPALYNKGLNDARKVIEGKLEDVQVDIDALKQ